MTTIIMSCVIDTLQYKVVAELYCSCFLPVSGYFIVYWQLGSHQVLKVTWSGEVSNKSISVATMEEEIVDVSVRLN